jgi:hypothetical protein
MKPKHPTIFLKKERNKDSDRVQKHHSSKITLGCIVSVSKTTAGVKNNLQDFAIIDSWVAALDIAI